MRPISSFLAMMVVCAVAAQAQEKTFSGPQPGEKITAFKVLQIAGSQAGKEIEVLKDTKGKPTLLVFVHKITEPVIGLMIPLEWYARKVQKEGLVNHVVFLTDDKAETERRVKRWWNHWFEGMNADISLDGIEGPGRYGLNRKIAMTVLVAKGNKVVKNFAIVDPNRNDAAPILDALAKAMGKEAPNVDKLRAEIRANNEKRRRDRVKNNPVFKLAPNEKLGALMLGMIHGENNAASVRERAAAMIRWAGDGKEKQAALRQYCKAVVEKFEYNKYAAKHLKNFAAGKLKLDD